jgi:hypothetical protein
LPDAALAHRELTIDQEEMAGGVTTPPAILSPIPLSFVATNS